MSCTTNAASGNTTRAATNADAHHGRSWYVSNSGDDGNDGLSPATAFQTLAHLSSVYTSGNIYIERGSRFREQLTGLPVGAVVLPYGSGSRPIIDGRNVAVNANFVAVGGGTPNVYSIAWSHSIDASGGVTKHRVWEDGTLLTRVSSLANCDSTAGSFYSPSITTNGPDTIYVHPTGDTNPTTDGKQYTITSRRWALQLYDSENQARVGGIATIGNAHKDGSLCVDGYANDCTANDGWIHNAFIIGEANGCTATGIDASEDFAIFVTYIDANKPSDGRNTIFTNCSADTGSGYAGLGSGFYAHTDGVRNHGTIQYNDCSVVGCSAAYSGIQAETFIYYKCGYTHVLNAYSAVGNARTVILGGSGQTEDSANNNNTILSYSTTAAFTLLVRGAKLYRLGSGIGPISIDCANATISITRCTLVGKAASGQMFSKLISGSYTWSGNVLDGPNMSTITIASAGAQLAGFVADNNVYHPSSGGIGIAKEFGGHVDYTTLADWRTYLASVSFGPETNTVTTDPQLADPANGDFTVGSAAIIALGAGAEQDEEDDATLQSYWTLYRVS